MLTYDFPFTLIPFVFEKVKRVWPVKANAWLLPISPVCGHWKPVWCLKPLTPAHRVQMANSNAMDLSIISVDKKWPLYDGSVWKDRTKRGLDMTAAVTLLKWFRLKYLYVQERLSWSTEPGCCSLLQRWKEFSTADSFHVIHTQKTANAPFFPLLPIQRAFLFLNLLLCRQSWV